jgi:hypothetical protein
MLTLKKHNTAELERQVIAELAPQMKRRASAHVPISQTQEPIPVSKSTHKPLSRRRIYATLLLGLLVGLVLIILGTIVANWIGDTLAHWHGGDGGVVTLDADTGHSAGTSHLLAFYQQGYVIVVECNRDCKSYHIASIRVSGGATENHHTVGLQLQTIDGRRDLVITLDGGIQVVLYNTGDSFSQTPARG